MLPEYMRGKIPMKEGLLTLYDCGKYTLGALMCAKFLSLPACVLRESARTLADKNIYAAVNYQASTDFAL